jgi:thioredoxin reductase (NADPH)
MASPVARVLSPDQLDMLAGHGEERTAAVGDVLFEVGDATYPFIAIREGEAAILDPTGREIVRHGASGFLGEMNLLSGQTVFLTAVVTEPMRYVEVDRETLRSLLFEDGVLSDTLLSAFVQRRELLQQQEGVGIEIVGPTQDHATRDLVEFAKRQRLPYSWHDSDTDPATAALIAGLAPEELPLVRLPGGAEMKRPTNGELSRALGIGLELPPREEVDLLIVGGGPAGLGAAVYGASEGLDTLVVESNVLGGQAGTSRRIENYLGFPAGISGTELISRAITQARKFAARTATPYRALSLEPGGDGDHVVKLEGGREVTAKAVLLSTGAEYRKLPVDNLDEYEGLSVFYAAGPPEAQICGAQRVGVVGGGNSAAQAAVWLARGGALVTLLHRRADLAETMSAYLIDELDRYGVAVRDRSEICELRGADGRLENVKLTDGTELPFSFLFLFLGASPCTGWLGDQVARDEKGFVLTGAEAGAEGLLETSVPGVYAAGDVRAGSIKRCATAVGEGATVIRFVHERMMKLRDEHRESEAAGSAAVGAEPGRG